MVMKKKSVVKIDLEIMSGTPCFAGTRVPVRTLIDYIEGGETLDEFLRQYPTVSRKQAVAYLEESAAILEKPLQPVARNAMVEHIRTRAGTWDGNLSGVELLRRTRP